MANDTHPLKPAVRGSVSDWLLANSPRYVLDDFLTLIDRILAKVALETPCEKLEKIIRKVISTWALECETPYHLTDWDELIGDLVDRIDAKQRQAIRDRRLRNAS